MKDLIELSKSQILMGFVASCVESLAKRLHNDTATMYHRMDAVGMIDNYLISFYDTLHTESRPPCIRAPAGVNAADPLQVPPYFLFPASRNRLLTN